MQFSLELRTASLSVGEFSDFAVGPQESGGGAQGLWRAQLGQHWHNELRTRTEQENSVAGAVRGDVAFEVPIESRLIRKGWTFTLTGRIDQIVGPVLREIKTVTRPLPVSEQDLRTDYPAYFLQLAAYSVLRRALGCPAARSELVFVETSTGLAQTVVLSPFDEALVHHQLDVVVEFLDQRLRATARRRALTLRPAFAELRPGQETIQADLAASFNQSRIENQKSKILLFEAPTGYGKTGCVMEFALGRLRAGEFSRLIWLTGKSTGQLQVVQTLQRMSAGDPPSFWQVRNKSEHCVNTTFHCVRDACSYLAGAAERWPQSGLAKFYLDDHQPRDLATLRDAGRHALICPYEITRASLAFNDVWIGDFNYVFSPDNRGIFFDQPGFDPRDTLLVIDEAHNLPTRVADAYSHTANYTDAHALLAGLDHLQAPALLTLAVEEWTRLLSSLQPAESLDPALAADIADLIGRLANLVTTQPLDYAALGPQLSETLWQFVTLRDWLDGHVSASPPQSKIENPKSKIQRLLWSPRAGELAFTCLDAAPMIGETLRSFGGAILMSATLQPFATYAETCGLSEVGRGVPAEPRLTETVRPTYTTLSAPTPWRAGCYDIGIDVRVDTTYRQRANHYGTTAQTIEELHRASSAGLSARNSRLSTPALSLSNGLNSQLSRSDPRLSTLDSRPSACIAVFFPSYAYAESVLRALEHDGSVLRATLQPRLPDLAAQAAWVEENLALSDALFLVLGSSFAESIDLLGGRVSHAMVVGPALPEVNAVQKAKVAANSESGRDAAFRRVYQVPGLQKVNQALGRLVRAPGQHAKVLLHCRRFADPSYAALLARDYQFGREIASTADLREWLGGNAS